MHADAHARSGKQPDRPANSIRLCHGTARPWAKTAVAARSKASRDCFDHEPQPKVYDMRKAPRYFDWLIMYSTAAFTSASFAAPPLGGIGFLPFMTTAVSASAPCLISGAQAALSPDLRLHRRMAALARLVEYRLAVRGRNLPCNREYSNSTQTNIARFMSCSFHVDSTVSLDQTGSQISRTYPTSGIQRLFQCASVALSSQGGNSRVSTYSRPSGARVKAIATSAPSLPKKGM